MARRVVNMRIPEELVAKVDRQAGGRRRTDFTVRALERALSAERPRSLAELMRDQPRSE